MSSVQLSSDQNVDFTGSGAVWDNNLPRQVSEYLKSAKVKRLAIGTNSLGVGAAKELSELLKKCSELEILHLDSIFMGRDVYDAREALKQIFESIIESKCTLKEIKLDHNALGSQCSDELVKFFSNPNILASLEKVSLNDCGFAILSAGKLAEGMQFGFDDLQKSGKKCKITSFEMSFNRIEDRGVESMCEVLSKNLSMLQKITFSMCMLGDSGTSEVAKILKTNPIQELEIGDTFIGPISSSKLREAFIASHYLKSIDISYCMAKGDGAADFLKGLTQSNSPIESLKFIGNEFGTEHFSDLNQLLISKCNSLISIDLQENLLLEEDLLKLHRTVLQYFNQSEFKLLSDPIDLTKLDNEFDETVKIFSQFLQTSDPSFILQKVSGSNSNSLSIAQIINEYLESFTKSDDFKIFEVLDRVSKFGEDKAITIDLLHQILNSIISFGFNNENSFSNHQFADILLSMCDLLKIELEFEQISSKYFLLQNTAQLIDKNCEIFSKKFIEIFHDILKNRSNKSSIGEKVSSYTNILNSLSKLAI